MDELPENEDWRVRKELNLMGADPDIMWRPMDTLSGGERTKLMLANLFASDGIYPLIDEPTNHLDRKGREAVADYLASKDGFILISHDRAFLDRCTDHTLVITKTGLELVGATYSVWWENNEQRMESEKARNDQLKKEMSSIDAAMKKNAQWSSKAEGYKNRSKAPSKVAEDHFRRAYEAEKARKLMSAAKNLERRNERKMEEKQGLLKDLERTETLKITGTEHHNKTPVIMKDVTLKRYGEPVVTGFDLTVERGNKISLQGRNGCGKSTLIKYLAGLGEQEGITAEGDIYIAPGLKISYVGQDTSSLAGTLYDIASERGADKTVFSTILIKMGFTKEMLYRDVSRLSLGQKKMTYLSYAFASNASHIILDEPTNGLDITAMRTLRKLIASNMTDDRTIIISTHHINEISSLLDHIVILNNRKVAFDHSVHETGRALSFVESDKETDKNNALYSMSSAYGNRLILPNTSGIDSEIDYELLYEAVLDDSRKINALF